MSEDWNSIAQEVSAEIASIGFDVVIEQPSTVNSGTVADPEFANPTLVTLKAIERMVKRKDAEGVVLEVVRQLMVPVGSVVPEKGMRVQVRGVWHRIDLVYALAPGGVDLYYKFDLVS